DENSDLGTPRGGCRTVPIRSPSLGRRSLPNLSTRIAIRTSSVLLPPHRHLRHHVFVLSPLLANHEGQVFFVYQLEVVEKRSDRCQRRLIVRAIQKVLL